MSSTFCTNHWKSMHVNHFSATENEKRFLGRQCEKYQPWCIIKFLLSSNMPSEMGKCKERKEHEQIEQSTWLTTLESPKYFGLLQNMLQTQIICQHFSRYRLYRDHKMYYMVIVFIKMNKALACTYYFFPQTLTEWDQFCSFSQRFY